MGAYAGVDNGQWEVPTLDEQVERAEAFHTDDLLYCKNPWALRHYWINRTTGERQRARCNRWECLHCGPRKVDLWRRLVREAAPTLFLTLTRAGKTVEEARRALTTFIQALRRGSKGRGPNRKGARAAYPIEYFGVLERHEDFERNGFHWHLLVKGVEHIPYKEVIQPLWMSATHYQPATDEDEGRGAMIAHIERIRNHRAIGYVTKYMTKTLSVGEKGTKQVNRGHLAMVVNDDGNKEAVMERVKVEVSSKAHRLCYSRQFFPEKVADLRKRLFAGLDGVQEGENGRPLGEEEPETCSDWVLVDTRTEQEEAIEEYKQVRYQEVTEELAQARGTMSEQEYQRRKLLALADMRGMVGEMWADELRRKRRERLREVLEERRIGGKRLSRRVIHVWHYQRRALLAAGLLVG